MTHEVGHGSPVQPYGDAPHAGVILHKVVVFENLPMTLCDDLLYYFRGSAIHRWVCEGGGGAGGNGTSRRGGVTSMDHHDMTGDGIRDLIVGRDDGSLEVYSYEDGDESEPTMRFSMVSKQ